MTTNDDMLRAMLRQQPQPSSVTQPVRQATQQSDKSDIIGEVATWMLLLSFGVVFAVINGGFSIIGMQHIALLFNGYGELFWQFLTLFTFTLPIQSSLLPATQPVLPWLGVAATSVLQIIVSYRKIKNIIGARNAKKLNKPFVAQHIPMWLVVIATGISIFDYGTTLFGVRMVSLFQNAGLGIQIVVALLLTFAFELAVGFMIALHKLRERLKK